MVPSTSAGIVTRVRIALPGFAPARYLASTVRCASVICASVSGRTRGDVRRTGRLLPGSGGADQRRDVACGGLPAAEATSAAIDDTHNTATVITRISCFLST